MTESLATDSMYEQQHRHIRQTILILPVFYT
jgi:hypothetical protein